MNPLDEVMLFEMCVGHMYIGVTVLSRITVFRGTADTGDSPFRHYVSTVLTCLYTVMV